MALADVGAELVEIYGVSPFVLTCRVVFYSLAKYIEGLW